MSTTALTRRQELRQQLDECGIGAADMLSVLAALTRALLPHVSYGTAAEAHQVADKLRVLNHVLVAADALTEVAPS